MHPHKIEKFISDLPFRAFDWRAVRRREQLGITKVNFAKIVGVPLSRFRRWEGEGFLDKEAQPPETCNSQFHSLWEAVVTNAPRPEWLTEELQNLWEDTLKVPRGWLLDSAQPILSILPITETHKVIVSGGTPTEELLMVCRILTQRRVDQAKVLNADLLSKDEIRRVAVLAMHYQLFDENHCFDDSTKPGKKATHKEIAQVFGFSKSRSSQILHHMLRKARAYQGRFKFNKFCPEAPNVGMNKHTCVAAFCREVLLIDLENRP